jgi:hypothetical protein
MKPKFGSKIFSIPRKGVLPTGLFFVFLLKKSFADFRKRGAQKKA